MVAAGALASASGCRSAPGPATGTSTEGTGFRRSRDTDAVLRELEDVVALAEADTSGLVRARPTSVYGITMSDELGRGLAEHRHAATTCPSRPTSARFATRCRSVRRPSATHRCGGSARLGLLGDRTMAVHCAHLDEGERRMLLDAPGPPEYLAGEVRQRGGDDADARPSA